MGRPWMGEYTDVEEGTDEYMFAFSIPREKKKNLSLWLPFSTE